MKQVQALLLEGQGEAARRRLGALLREYPDKTAAAADAVARLLTAAYDQFYIQPVHDFCSDLETDLPALVTERVRRDLESRIRRTNFWRDSLWGVTRERLGRECRAQIVTHHAREAAARAEALFERARNDAELEENCLLLATALAELHRDRPQVQAMIEFLAHSKGPGQQVVPLFARRLNKAIEDYGTSQYESSNQAWLRQQIEAISALLGYLPPPTEADEPAPEAIDRFHEEIHAVARAGLARGNMDDLIDALIVLSEYCPSDPQVVQNVAGAEDRMFIRLGPAARAVAVRALARLGEQEPLRRRMLELAASPHGAGQDRLKMLTAVIGGLRHEAFGDYLRQALAGARVEREEGWIVDAMSRLATPAVADELIERLRAALRKCHDPAQERRAYLLLTA
ncbi:MAG: hypothetical protein M1457_01240, partial [bacterium]|nr:hypothetical protein [bacterium]